MSYIEELRVEMNVPRSVKEAAPNISREEYMSKVVAMADAALEDRCTPFNPKVPNKLDIIRLFVEIYDHED